MKKEDILDKGNEIEINLNFDGIDNDDLHLNITDDFVEVKARKQNAAARENEDYFISKKSFAEIYRKIIFPEKIDADETKTSFENGVLTIVAPKKNPKELP